MYKNEWENSVKIEGVVKGLSVNFDSIPYRNTFPLLEHLQLVNP